MKNKWLIVGAVMMVALFTAAAALAGNAIKLVVNEQELQPDVAPQLVHGRTLVPLRWVAEAMGHRVEWEEETRTVFVHQGDWLTNLERALDRAAHEFAAAPGNEGRVEGLWRVDQDVLLLEYVRGRDYEYHLCHGATLEKKQIVHFIENARLEEVSAEELRFIAKGGGDTGNYQFPYLLRYDIPEKKLSEEPLFLERDVVFGASRAWQHDFAGVMPTAEGMSLRLQVAEDQVLAGGHKTPLTVVTTADRTITLRIYGVSYQEGDHALLELQHPFMERIEWKTLPADESAANLPLLEKDFPYGGAWGDSHQYELHEPSLLVKIHCRAPVAFHLETRTFDLTLEYRLQLRHPE